MKAGDRRWLRRIDPGGSFLCSGDMRALFGLGKAETVDGIEVNWPDGSRDVRRGAGGSTAEAMQGRGTRAGRGEGKMRQGDKETGTQGERETRREGEGVKRRSLRSLLISLFPYLLVSLCLLVLGTAAGAWWWRRPTPPPLELPDVPLADADPAVAAAVRTAQDWVQRGPNSANAWGGLGGVLLANDFPVPADACLARAEQLDPNEARWPYLRAWGLLPRDRDAAIEALRRAVDRSGVDDANGVVVRLRLADTLLTVGANEEAGRLYRTVLDHDPANVRAHFGAGMVAAALDDVKAAVDHLSRCADSPYARKKACAELAALYQRHRDAGLADKYPRGRPGRAKRQGLRPTSIWRKTPSWPSGARNDSSRANSSSGRASCGRRRPSSATSSGTTPTTSAPTSSSAWPWSNWVNTRPPSRCCGTPCSAPGRVAGLLLP